MSAGPERKLFRPMPYWKAVLWIVGMIALLFVAQMLFAAVLRGVAPAGASAHPAEQIAAVSQSRGMPEEAPTPVRVTLDIPDDERARARATFAATDEGRAPGRSAALAEAPAWYPREQSPVCDALEEQGALEPVAARVGPEPVVLRPCDGPGVYGGTWQRVANSAGDVSTIGWRLANATLMRYSPLGEPVVPHVAREVTSEDGGKTWIVTLRRIRWSDGHPLTSADMAYTWEHEWMDPERGGGRLPRQLYAGGQAPTFRVLDERRVEFKYPVAFPMFPEVLTSAGIGPQPAHFLKPFHPRVGDPAVIEAKRAELGLGSARAVYGAVANWTNPDMPNLWPWIYKRYKTGSPQVFVRNPYYYAVDEQGRQLPYIDRVQFEVMDERLLPMAAASGRMSMQQRFVRFENYTDIMSQAAGAGTRMLHWIPGTRSDWLIYPNLNRAILEDDPATAWKATLLADKRFRQALSLALDRPKVIDALYHGLTRPTQVEPGPISPYHHPTLARAFIVHDPERANALLDELWREAGADPALRVNGARAMPDGTPLTFYLDYCEFTGMGAAQFVVDDWAKVGVRCVYRQRARNLFYLEKAARNFDMLVWTSDSESTPLMSPRVFIANETESNYAIGWGMWFSRGGMYGTPESKRPGAIEVPVGHPMRDAMEEYEKALLSADLEERRAHMARVFDIAAENLWTINLCEAPPALVVVDRDMMNVPEKAVASTILVSPGHTGVETYAFRHPDGATLADTVQQILRPEGLPIELAKDAGGGRWIVRMIVGIVLLLLVMIGLRHPFVLRRMLIMVPTLLVISVCVFTIIQLPPGDFLSSKVMQLQEAGLSTERIDQEVEQLKELFHYDEPVVKRYFRWLGVFWFGSFDDADRGLLQGQMGRSMETQKSVNSMVGDRILLTMLVSAGTILLTYILALPIGIYSACRLYSPGDYFFSFLGFVGMSLPAFLLALILMAITGVSGLFSAKYAVQPFWDAAKVVDLLKHIWLPVLVMGITGTAGMIRIMRANLLDELRKPYVTTARAKGLRPLKLLLKYPVRLALNPFISGIGSLFPRLLSGGALVAIVMSLPTVEPLMLSALFSQDMNMAGSMLMVLSLLSVFGTLVSDLLLLWLDPRVRLGGGEDK